MSTPKPPDPAKLVIGLFMKDKTLLDPIAKTLENAYGPIDMVSEWMPFDYTEYYEPETGTPLFRRMLVFQRLIEQADLVDIKIFTNTIETSYSENSRRRVNIDPGYMLRERFVLATGKNFTHRIYLGKGIYADLTLIYQKGDFRALPWTFPDYADKNMLAFLHQVRNKYSDDLKRNARIKTV